VESAKAAMLDAQATANDQPNSMGDKFESFREQMQIDRDLFARRYDDGLKMLETLRKADVEKKYSSPAPGAIVVTDRSLFFIAASMGQVQLDDQTFLVVSVHAPIFTAMAGLKVGQSFTFRDVKYLVEEIF
jgi:hypothetical protein